MNKITVFLCILVMAAGFCLAWTLQGKAAPAKGFAGVIPFSTSSDRIGFFDQNTGKIYMYDNNINQCLFIGQIQTLGQPIQAARPTGS
ncbi:MAG: hypothetical protein KGK03_07635 [Candidatus Omnitrophica bacterium]|nr:hypothetical protein [Candidatus Omnitrophota bacterium]MDE2222927.1 hypothetical protein [Candidatus Omnitrophota bacterium]